MIFFAYLHQKLLLLQLASDFLLIDLVLVAGVLHRQRCRRDEVVDLREHVERESAALLVPLREWPGPGPAGAWSQPDPRIPVIFEKTSAF